MPLPDPNADWLRALYENALDGMAIADVQTKQLAEANPAFCRMLGCSLDEVRRLRVHDIHPPDRLDQVLAAFDRQVRENGWIAMNTPLLRRDGSVLQTDINSAVVTFQGHPHLLGIFRDATDRIQAEAALKASQVHYRTAAQLLSDYVFTLSIAADGQATLRSLSSNFDRITGRRPADVVQPGSWIETVHPEDRPRLLEVLQRLIRDGGEDRSEFRSFVLQGDQEVPRWVAVVSRAQRDPTTGRVTSIMGAVRDISARKAAELELHRTVAELEHRERLLRFLNENLGDGMVYQIDSGVNGKERTFSYLSPAVQRLHGLTVEAVQQNPALLYGQVVEEDRALLQAREAHSFETMTSLDMEVRTQLPSGGIRWRHFRSTPRRLPGGNVVWDGIEFDVTDRHELEERLRQSEKLTAIGELAGGIAHDFNNQLAGVMGYADLLLLGLEPGPLREYAQGIALSARRAADLTQQLLAYARKGKYLSVPVDLHRLIAEVIAMLKRSVDKRIRIRQALRASRPTILGDPSQIQNALLNLALNARDAMPDGGELSFETDTARFDEDHCRTSPFAMLPGSYLVVQVSDTGRGMADEVKRHLFEPFFTTKPPGEGTGMGLASVYGTVQGHHGAIQVQSEIGRGTTVRIDLPLAPESVRAEDPIIPAAAPTRGTAHVLLVDDEPTVREAAAHALRDLGYTVTACADGRDAVDYYQAHWHEVDLVILDLVMPRLNGHDTFIALRRVNPQVRALLSSGYSLDGAAQAILNQGAIGFVGKPYRQADLAQRIQEALAAPA